MTGVFAYFGIGLLIAALARLEQRGPIPLTWWLSGLLLWPFLLFMLGAWWVAALLRRLARIEL